MTSISINTFEEIHHTCLMFGLKKAYRRFPFLAANILATPPPFIRRLDRPLLRLGGRINPTSVQYYKKDIAIIYDEKKNTSAEITEFAKAIVEEYLLIRHPYMKYRLEGNTFMEATCGYVIAKINSAASPEPVVDTP